MSLKLSDYGVGLLRTHVTWEDIQKDIQKIFGDSAKFGEKKTVTSIGDGRGFMSKMCLIEPDWVSKPLMAPEKFIVKVCTQIQSREMGEKMAEQQNGENPFDNEALMDLMEAATRTVHNTEINMYKQLKKHNVKIPRPTIYHCVPYSEENKTNGYIIMEYLEGAVNITIYDNVDVEDLKQPLRALAVLEAASLKFSDEEKASFTMNPLTDIFAAVFTEDMIAQTLTMFRGFGGERLGERIDKLEKAIPTLVDIQWYNGIGEDLGLKKVLCHGDLWSTNMIWNKTDNESLKLAAILDYQTAHFGMTAVDLCRLMNACMSGKNRRENWEMMTRTFYGYLEEEVKGGEMPFSLEQLLESVRRFTPLGAFLLVPMIGPLFQLTHMNPDPEEKAKVLELVMEKTECLLDDMLEMHERNMTLKKEKHGENGNAEELTNGVMLCSLGETECEITLQNGNVHN